MKKLPLFFVLGVAIATAQTTPTHILVTENLSDPTHPKIFATFPSTGADSYNVYEAEINNLTTGCAPIGTVLTQTQVWPDGSIHRAGSPAYVLDTMLAGGIPAADAMHPFNIDYSDDPNPGLGQLPALKQAGGRGWCYAVSSVLNGRESQPSAPQEVWLGFSAYYAWSYYSTFGCLSKNRVAYPAAPSAFHPHLFFRDPSGVDHEFAYVDNTVFVDNGGKGQDEVEFHLPTIAIDGTQIPLLDASQNGPTSYYVEWKTPDGHAAVTNLVPPRQGDHVYYNEISTGFVEGEYDYWDNCQGTPGSWWQDTSY